LRGELQGSPCGLFHPYDKNIPAKLKSLIISSNRYWSIDFPILSQSRSVEEQSTDPAARQMLERASELGLSTAFSRADDLLPCNIGSAGMCCKLCGMGPCRLKKDVQTGVCGATIDTIQARNLIRSIAAGSSAHSDHGWDTAFILKAAAKGEAEGYKIRDVPRLYAVASRYGIPIEKRPPEAVAIDLADLYPAQFGQQRGQVAPVVRAPKKRQELWQSQGVTPRGIDGAGKTPSSTYEMAGAACVPYPVKQRSAFMRGLGALM